MATSGYRATIPPVKVQSTLANDTSATLSELAIIPALNEAPRIGAVIAGLRLALPAADIVVIDDGSSDGTGDVARRAGARVVMHPFSMGYGSALETGYRYALARDYRRCLQLDADGQHAPTVADALMVPLREGRADVVVGSRFLAGPVSMAASRRAGRALLRMLARVLRAVELTDPTSGYRGFDRRALAMVLALPFPDDYPELDVLITFRRAGIRVLEIPVPTLPRAGGRSMHAGGRPLFYAYKVALSAFIRVSRAGVAPGRPG